MAVNTVYNQYKNNLVTGTAAIVTGTTGLFVALVTSAYTAAVTETDTWAANISAYEHASTGSYARQNLGNVTVTELPYGGSGIDDEIMIDADDTSFGATTTITATGAVLYLGTAGTVNTIVEYIDFGGSKSSSAGNFTIVWSTDGILRFKQSV